MKAKFNAVVFLLLGIRCTSCCTFDAMRTWQRCQRSAGHIGWHSHNRHMWRSDDHWAIPPVEAPHA